MYPLNVSLPAPLIGYAVASNEAEHQALTGMGYMPAYVAQSVDRAALMEQAAAKGLSVDGRWSDARLAKELAAMG